MPADRLLRILSKLSAAPGSEQGARLCEVCADVAEVSGAGIMLISREGPRGSVCSSDGTSATIEELQFTLGEGPCIDAYNGDMPVLEPDLRNPTTARWALFTPSAVKAGVGAIFGFPLQVGAARLGALNLHSQSAGALSDEQHADALVLAGVVARAVIDMQAHAPPGGFGPEFETGSEFRFVVHQASGMVAAQLEVAVEEALIRLRAYAFANERLLADVANDVVSRRLRFEPEGDLR